MRALLLLTLGLSACMDFSLPQFADLQLDTVPSVAATDPADGEVDVGRDAAIIIIFSKPMDPVSVSVTVSPDAPFSSAAWDQDDTRATLTASAVLPAATSYTVTVNGRDRENAPLAEYVFAFTTTAMGASGTTGPSGVTPGPPSAAQSTLDFIGTPVADGVTTTTVTFSCRDAAAVPCAPGVAVTLASNDPLDGPPKNGVTDATGSVSFALTSTHAGVRTLTATFSGGAVTTMLTFIAGAPREIVFESVPVAAAVTTELMGNVIVGLYDEHGNRTTASGVDVTVSLLTTGAVIGTLTRTSSLGTVTFDDLSLTRANPAHRLHASATGLRGADSAPFSVVAWRNARTTYKGREPTRLAWRPGSSVVYEASDKVFRSGDQGLSFELRSLGLPFTNEICALATDPINHDIVYAGLFGVGLFVSQDGGGTWAQLTMPAVTIPCAIIAPLPGTVVVGVGDHAPGVDTGVYKSVDYGMTFTPGTGAISALYVHDLATADGTTYYAATYGGGVHKSVDGGASWNAVNTGITDLSQHRVAVHPSNASIAYCGSVNGVYSRTTNGGTNWTAMTGAGTIIPRRISAGANNVFAVSDVVYKTAHGNSAYAVAGSGQLHGSPVNDFALATDESTIFALTAGLEKSTDGGTNWTLVGPSPEPPELDQIFVHHTGGAQNLFVTNLGGVWGATGFEARWYSMKIGLLDTDVLEFGNAAIGANPWVVSGYRAHRWNTSVTPNRFTLVSTSYDVYGLATNGTDTAMAYGVTGTTGRVAKAGVAASSFTNLAVSPPVEVTGIAMSQNASIVLAWTPTTIYRTTNGGTSGSWTAELVTSGITHVVFANTAVAYAVGGGGVYVSSDAGDNWTLHTNGLVGTTAWKLATHPTDPATVYAATTDGVYKSSDSGVTWRKASTGLAGSAQWVAVDPLTPETIYTTALPASGFTGGVYRSQSGGE